MLLFGTYDTDRIIFALERLEQLLFQFHFRALHNLFICIAENIPQCLEEVGSNYESYTFKPWNCSVSKHIKEYQEIVHKGCNKIESDFVPLKTEETGDQSSPSRTGDQSGYKMADQNDTSVGTTFHKHSK